MTGTKVDAFEEAIQRAETTHKLQWNFSGRDSLLKDLRRDLESVNGKFRYRANGVAVDIDDIITRRLQKGIYVKVRPGVKEVYQSPFKSRDEQTKKAHQELSKTYVLKALQHEGIVFRNSKYQEKALEVIAKHFLPEDHEDGVAFRRINDSEIGALPALESHNINALLNHLSMNLWIDDQATKISKLQHRAVLRKTAASMLPIDAKSKDIESQTDELYSFESRELRPGRKIPAFNEKQIEEEFKKFRELNGAQRSGPSTSVQKMQFLNDLSDVKTETRDFQIDNPPNQYEGF